MVQTLQNTDLEDSQKEKKKKKKGLSQKVINIIRTTQRNNIDLTAIADYKANVLLSLNAFILTVLVPYVFANIDLIFERYLYIPLFLAAATCFITIYTAAQVLKPSDFDKKRDGAHPDVKPSPFFFGNFYKMESDEYYEYLNQGLANNDLIKAHLSQDLYYVGRRLGVKMSRIRNAFNVFIVGIFLTLGATIIVLLF